MEAQTGEDIVNGKDPREYLAALRRHKVLILTVTLVCTAIAVFVALALPAVYRSTATILVQEQEVPPDLVRSTITSFADERIQVISQQVMTRAVLLGLIDKYELYEDLRDRLTTEEVLDRMRRDIKLSTINADISDRSSGRRVNATIAFTISYDAPDPERAQSVVNELVTLYLNENVKARQQSVAETNAFLAQEAERVARQIQAIEAKLAEFKRRNVGRMPDSSAVHVQLAERTEAELQRVERDISLLQDRRISLESQLALVKPTLAVPAAPAPAAAAEPRLLPSEERLRTLQAQYASISGVYGAQHPDVRRLQREIAALEAEVGKAAKGGSAEQRLKLEADLATLKERYGDDHPDVQRLRRSLAALEASDVKAPAAPRPAPPPERRPAPELAQRPDNPAYLMLSAQLEGVERELKQLASIREDLRAKQRSYDARLLQIPEVEREYSELTRDYGNAQQHYREIKTKQLQAEGALELEKDLKAERFSLGEPPTLPQRPFSPNRPAIALIGLMASLGGGLGLAFLRELIDPSVKGPLELARIATVPILTAIPYIQTQREAVGIRRRWIAGLMLATLLAAGFLFAVDEFARPLPDLLSSGMRRLGL
ncbi:MAG: hypothetical protein KJ018_15110 [Burkholderiales bacterium]|nr:hypothetical protein [Burkholderiales bacterium]